MSLFPSRAVALAIGPISIHWYGIMYLLGFLIGVYLLPRLMRYRKLNLSAAERESFLLYVFFGVLLGGRLGFVFFYGGSFYWSHPAEIFAVWHGGMSSHGGFIGVILATLLFCKRFKINFYALGDVLVIPVAIGLALGRFGNLINGELYGTLTTLPWGMYFPGAEGLRHPTQIYEAVLNLLNAFICYRHLKITGLKSFKAGITGSIFLIIYGVSRFIVEIFREQPYGFTTVAGFALSRGQLLTIPLFLLGLGLWYYRARALNGKLKIEN